MSEDATERVALDPDASPFDGPIERFAEVLRSAWRVEDSAPFMAQRVIEDYRAWLREQGVPIEQLLRGEMVAVPKEPTPEMLEHAYHGPVISWHRMIEAYQQAQLDHAGPEEKG